MDVTDMVDYNVEMLNQNALENSFFQLSISDPTLGFQYDASSLAGHVYPADASRSSDVAIFSQLHTRLLVGSHLAFHLRHKLDEDHGYTSTVGISTTKVISKLVGNKNKPKGQTTLLPPYDIDEQGNSNVLEFLDQHGIGAVPGIGFKMAQKLREYILKRPAAIETGLVYGPSREKVTVRDVRETEGLSIEMLERLLAGPGAPHGIGAKVFGLLYGIDDTEVNQARSVPRQISIEDSYVRLDTTEQVLQQLQSLSTRLLQRMRTDLTENLDEAADQSTGLRWLAYPSTLRLTTRPRLPLNSDGTRTRTFKRISRSSALPSYVFNLFESVDTLVYRLVKEALVPLFKKLHPERSGWNLSLVNVAVTGMDDGGNGKRAGNIGKMFRRMEQNEEKSEYADEQDTEMEEEANGYTVEEDAGSNHPDSTVSNIDNALPKSTDEVATHTEWDNNESSDEEMQGQSGLEYVCTLCFSRVPSFAKAAHERFHSMGD